MEHRDRTVRTIWTITLMLVVVSLLAGCGSAGTTPLKYRFEAGDSFAYDLAVTLDGSVEGPGIPAGESQAMRDLGLQMGVSWTVDHVEDGIATITYRYTELRMTQNGRPIDADVPTMPPITVTMDATGKVLSVEGLEGTMPPGLNLGNGLPFDPAQFMAQTNVVFPQDGLAEPGDEWTAESSVEIPGAGQSVTATSKARLMSVEKVDGTEVANIDFNVDVPMDLTLDLGALLKEMGLDQMMPAGSDPQDLAFKMSLQGQEILDGSTQVDTGNGMPESLEADLTVTLVIAVTDAPAAIPQDQRGPFSIDVTAHLSMTRIR
ncbi:MAG: hypothetical protein M5U22_00405 [Thermoleophilia bacterium]|nr:hypothetical protein [Thermoleophilia bacterium]